MTDLQSTNSDNRARTARLLRAHNIVPTIQRVEIAEILLRVSQHMSAEQLIDELRHRSRVSKATVYNSLKLFAAKGLIREVNVHSDRLIYDSNVRPHHHFYNIDTGELQDIDPADIQLTGLPTPPEGTVQDGVDIVIRVRRSPASRA